MVPCPEPTMLTTRPPPPGTKNSKLAFRERQFFKWLQRQGGNKKPSSQQNSNPGHGPVLYHLIQYHSPLKHVLPIITLNALFPQQCRVALLYSSQKYTQFFSSFLSLSLLTNFSLFLSLIGSLGIKPNSLMIPVECCRDSNPDTQIIVK